jgi:hypothetical protein
VWGRALRTATWGEQRPRMDAWGVPAQPTLHASSAEEITDDGNNVTTSRGRRTALWTARLHGRFKRENRPSPLTSHPPVASTSLPPFRSESHPSPSDVAADGEKPASYRGCYHRSGSPRPDTPSLSRSVRHERCHGGAVHGERTACVPADTINQIPAACRQRAPANPAASRRCMSPAGVKESTP